MKIEDWLFNYGRRLMGFIHRKGWAAKGHTPKGSPRYRQWIHRYFLAKEELKRLGFVNGYPDKDDFDETIFERGRE